MQDDLYFEFNVATRTMTLRKVQCEFQKHTYESVIVLVVLVLIFVLSSRMLHTVPEEYKSIDSSSQLSFSCSARLSHITTVGPSFFPQTSRSPRPTD